MRRCFGLIIVFALSACGGATGGSSGAGISVGEPWVRAALVSVASDTTAASAKASAMSGHDMGGAEETIDTDGAVSAGYMTLRNAGSEADRLLEASSDAAGDVQMHTSEMKNNVMSMRRVQAIDVPAGETVAIGPGGYHLMLVDLKRDLVAGETVKLTLRFERAGTVEVDALVRDAAPAVEQ